MGIHNRKGYHRMSGFHLERIDAVRIATLLRKGAAHELSTPTELAVVEAVAETLERGHGGIDIVRTIGNGRPTSEASPIEIRVTNAPDEDGDYFARVFVDGMWNRSFHSGDRDEAIADARRYVEWYRDRDSSEEIIEP
jgi:hypothetical protein